MLFRDFFVGNVRVLINTPPSTIRTNVFMENAEKVYSFIDNNYRAINLEYYLDYEDTFNILVIGPTGAGKSRFINLIFNQEIVHSESSMVSITRDICFIRGITAIKNKTRDVILVDTVGLCDTECKPTDVIALLKDRVNANMNKIHAVYVLVEANRLLPEVAANIKEALTWLKYYEGNQINF
jgi:predicted GTPase